MSSDDVPATTPAQDVTIDAIREHHGVATVGRSMEGEVVVVVPQDRSFCVLLDGDAVDLEENRLIPKAEVQEHGC